MDGIAKPERSFDKRAMGMARLSQYLQTGSALGLSDIVYRRLSARSVGIRDLVAAISTISWQAETQNLWISSPLDEIKSPPKGFRLSSSKAIMHRLLVVNICSRLD